MSRRYENDCVYCGLPCLGIGCRYYRVAVDTCDFCGEDRAEYRFNGEDMCKECARKALNECFKELTQEEKEQALGITADELLQEVFDDLTMTKQADTLDVSFYKIDD